MGRVNVEETCQIAGVFSCKMEDLQDGRFARWKIYVILRRK